MQWSPAHGRARIGSRTPTRQTSSVPRARVDRTTSRQLLDQEQFDQKLDQIMRRQTTLESRATALGAVPDASVTGSIRAPARGAAATDAAGSSGTPKPSPISDTVIFVAPPDREARLESR